MSPETFQLVRTMFFEEITNEPARLIVVRILSSETTIAHHTAKKKNVIHTPQRL